MKYIKIFKEHSLYDASKGELEYPSLSYCEKENEVHYGSNLGNIRFYVGDLSGKTDQTVVINYSGGTRDTVSIPEGNKWYSHNIPNGKTLSSVTNLDYIKEAVVNCDKAYAQDWKNVEKVSYFNCGILGGNFNSCSFTSLDVRTVDTSNVTDMTSMFYYCSGLKSLDLSNFNTSNVTNMNRMFNSCRSLTSLDLSNFNTSKVTNMLYMFDGCSGLTSLDLSNFDTSNVKDMSRMFSFCTYLTSLDLSGWDMTNVTDKGSMLNGCYSLKKITMKGCSQDTIDKIKASKPANATIITE